MPAMIETTDLTKSYGGARGITNVSLTVNEGEIFGFLGPNGAGKTTMIRLLLGLLHPTSGQATVGGHDCWADPVAVKRLVGYLPGEFAIDPGLTGAQVLSYLGNLRGGVDHAYRQELAERLGLDLTRKFREYSRGNKQKVGLVQAFMGRPRLLILDEPTGGLDPLNQQTFYDIVRDAHADGATVFLSSHILPEVEHTCHRVGIIREGELVNVDQVAALKDLKQHLVELTFPAPVALEAVAAVPGVQNPMLSADGLVVHCTVAGDFHELLQFAAQHGVTNIVSQAPSLEEIFLRYYQS